MREIKFKAYDKIIHKQVTEPMCYYMSIDDNGTLNIMHNIAARQLIGLKDKNNKNIYGDCDIFKFKYMEQLHKPVELIGIMIWNDSELRYEIEVFNNDYYCVLSYLDNGTFYDFEIIGNKFENPELLK